MAEGNRYRVNAPKVIHETLDGETVIVNLDSGAYYSLEQAARAAWLAFAAGATLAETAEHLAKEFCGQRAAIEAETGVFLADLIKEGLLVPGEITVAPILGETEKGRPAYKAPVLGKYTDMQELLLQDPVHEVDAAAGWPHPKPQA